MSKPLLGQVALVSGASRGIGKGLAFELSKAGATVYATGRNPATREQVKGAGNLNDLVQDAAKVGGTIIPVFCDHTDSKQVKELFERIAMEQNGRLDVLVNNAVTNLNHLIENAGKKFFEYDDDPGHAYNVYNDCGLRGNYICSYYAAKLMVPRKSGVIVTIGSRGSIQYMFNVLYGVQKVANDRMIADMAVELKYTGVHTFGLHPGPVETEMFQSSSVDNKQFATDRESIYFAGRCLVNLLQDSEYVKSKNGRVLTTTDVSERYNVEDLNGNKIRHPLQITMRPLYDAMEKVRNGEILK